MAILWLEGLGKLRNIERNIPSTLKTFATISVSNSHFLQLYCSKYMMYTLFIIVLSPLITGVFHVLFYVFYFFVMYIYESYVNFYNSFMFLLAHNKRALGEVDARPHLKLCVCGNQVSILEHLWPMTAGVRLHIVSTHLGSLVFTVTALKHQFA
jgi:hypothetical protein